MRGIKVFWYKHNKGHGNFGDELNPYIIEKLSGQKVVQVNNAFLENSRLIALKILLFNFLFAKEKLKSDEKKALWASILKKPVLFAIGSVISMYSQGKIVVWGSGLMHADNPIRPAKFLAVRGKYTQKRILDLGMTAPETLGDPALLLPLLYNPTKTKRFSIGIIPHYNHYNEVKNKYSNSDVLVINLLDPIEKVIDEICSCGLTLSTSLHGIIVSHAYGIPSVWASFRSTEKIKLAGDDIKFYDYFSSVNLPELPPVEIGDIPNVDLLNKMIFDCGLKSLPSPEIIQRAQKDLLLAAPFKLLDKYVY